MSVTSKVTFKFIIIVGSQSCRDKVLSSLWHSLERRIIYMDTKALKELKEKLIAERALSQSDAQNTQIAIEKVKTNIGNLTPEHLASLQEVGVDVTLLQNVDYDRLAKDQKYVDKIVEQFDALCNQTYTEILNRLGD